MRDRIASVTPRLIKSSIQAGVQAGRRLGYLRARYPRPLGSRPDIGLAVCAIFRDEAPYLAEWVTFHRLQGVERFWLYDNGSRDDWRSALSPEIFEGIVRVTPWPTEPGQFSAYADCLRRHRQRARWIAFIDIDEFLFSPTGRTLLDVLKGFEDVPAVAANWCVYGPNGYAERPDGLVVENYRWRARDDHPANRHVKSIVYPRKASTQVENPHHFRTYGPTVGEDRQPISSSFRDPATWDLLRVNHYCLKSKADLQWRLEGLRADLGRRRRRDEITVPLDEVEDDILVRFGSLIRRTLAERTGNGRNRTRGDARR